MFFFNKKKDVKHSKSKILIIADKEGWAYDSIAKSLIKYNNNPNIIFSLDYIKNKKLNLRKEHKHYDIIFFMGWQLLFEYDGNKIKEKYSYIDKGRILTGVHSHRSWDEGATEPGYFPLPALMLVEHLNKYAGVNFISRRLYQVFMEAGSTNAVCTLNGVDIERFRPKVKNNLNTDILVVGFSGAFKHDKLKGLSEYIIPAVEMVDNAELRIAMSENGEYLKHSKMVDYYNGIDLYICASSSEGFSLSVLEAAACGIPVLSTRVGGSEDLIVDGINGYYVDRNVADISNKITVMTNTKTRVQLGYNNRKIIEQFWSWEIRVGCWTSFIKSHIK